MSQVLIPSLAQSEMNEVTQLLDGMGRGEPQAAEQLLPLVYDELRRLASQRLAQANSGQTLQATALVHEAFLRLAGQDAGPQWQGRRHFFAAAALAMRRILIENARRKNREKHGGNWNRIELADHADPHQQESDQIIALEEALTRLTKADPRAAELVQLHIFAGLSVEEAGIHLGLSRTVAYEEWAFARAWLRKELGEIEGKTPDALR
jgi:RNA polymerase sigma factor (TIGR02999 family)